MTEPVYRAHVTQNLYQCDQALKKIKENATIGMSVATYYRLLLSCCPANVRVTHQGRLEEMESSNQNSKAAIIGKLSFVAKNGIGITISEGKGIFSSKMSYFRIKFQ